MWCRCSRSRILADLRDLLSEARVTPRRFYHAADIAIRLAGAGAFRRTLGQRSALTFVAVPSMGPLTRLDKDAGILALRRDSGLTEGLTERSDLLAHRLSAPLAPTS
jgi:hypothetical protein